MNNPSERFAHESDAIAGCVCNGCLRLEVLVERTHARLREKYYCQPVMHGYFDPRAVDTCDGRQEEAHVEFRPFNSGRL